MTSLKGFISSKRMSGMESQRVCSVSFIRSAQTGLENGYSYCGTWITLAEHASRIHWEV